MSKVDDPLPSLRSLVCALAAVPIVAAAGCTPSVVVTNGSSDCASASPSADGPHAGGKSGAPCQVASDCAERSCGCPGGGGAFFAAACINGRCDTSASACACAHGQDDVCASPPPPPTMPPPPQRDSCSGASESSQPAPNGGAPGGAACDSSAECAEVTCDCSQGSSFFAAACIGGHCSPGSACACVAQQFERVFQQDICK